MAFPTRNIFDVVVSHIRANDFGSAKIALEAMRIDLRGGDLFNKPTSTGGTLLHVLARSPHPESVTIAKWLIEQEQASAMVLGGQNKYPPIFNAISENNISMVRLLLRNMQDVDSRYGVMHYTLLHWAVLHGTPEIVGVILDAGANHDMLGASGTRGDEVTALNLAIRERKQEIVALLSQRVTDATPVITLPAPARVNAPVYTAGVMSRPVNSVELTQSATVVILGARNGEGRTSARETVDSTTALLDAGANPYMANTLSARMAVGAGLSLLFVLAALAAPFVALYLIARHGEDEARVRGDSFWEQFKTIWHERVFVFPTILPSVAAKLPPVRAGGETTSEGNEDTVPREPSASPASDNPARQTSPGFADEVSGKRHSYRV